MAVMEQTMEWNVYYYNFNARKIEPYNALAGREDAIRKLLKKSSNKEDFSNLLKIEMMYHYWSRCELEIILKPWIGRNNYDEEVKVDVYDQLRMNWARLVDYCWGFNKQKSTKE